MKRLAGIVGMGAGALIVLAGCSSMMRNNYLGRMGQQTAPNFSLKDLDGNTVQLSDFRGRPVVLTFWAYG